jgi:hypothetical protein
MKNSVKCSVLIPNHICFQSLEAFERIKAYANGKAAKKAEETKDNEELKGKNVFYIARLSSKGLWDENHQAVTGYGIHMFLDQIIDGKQNVSEQVKYNGIPGIKCEGTDDGVRLYAV